jgi:hypothetical protein
LTKKPNNPYNQKDLDPHTKNIQTHTNSYSKTKQYKNRPSRLTPTPPPGQAACTRVKPCEENQTKKNHLVLFEKYLIPNSGNALSTKQKPNKSIQTQTNSYKSKHVWLKHQTTPLTQLGTKWRIYGFDTYKRVIENKEKLNKLCHRLYPQPVWAKCSTSPQNINPLNLKPLNLSQ